MATCYRKSWNARFTQRSKNRIERSRRVTYAESVDTSSAGATVTSPFFLSRRSLLGALAGGLMAGSARAQSKPGAEIDLSGVTLRVAYYKGGWRALLQAAGEDKTPYKIDWKELNNGVLHIEALNSNALDLGSGSEIPAMFAA